MHEPPEEAGDDVPPLERAIATVSEVLLAVARGDFTARAPRSMCGDGLDVLAFLVNATAEEVGELVVQVGKQREDLDRARDHLALAEKLAALGQLAAGVAHELNQPLTAIRLTSDLLLMRADAVAPDVIADLHVIADAARRIGRVVDGIHAFARSGRLGTKHVPAGRPLDDAVAAIAAAVHGSGITLERRVPADLPLVEVDPARLTQVFSNLLHNARDALDEAPGPRADKRITVTIEHDPKGIRYTVEDNGCGVAAEHAQRIFDPFFTTKAVGRGEGLGLSIAHGIVAEHGATLRHEDAPGGGSRFSFHLPTERLVRD